MMIKMMGIVTIDTTLTLYDFNSLDERGQGESVFINGVFIDDREENKLNVRLCWLGGFYVELFYDTCVNGIVRYRSFKSAGQPAPYVRLSGKL